MFGSDKGDGSERKKGLWIEECRRRQSVSEGTWIEGTKKIEKVGVKKPRARRGGSARGTISELYLKKSLEPQKKDKKVGLEGKEISSGAN